MYDANLEDIRGFYSSAKGSKLWVEVDGEGDIDEVQMNVLKELLTQKPDSIKEFILKSKLDKAKQDQPAEKPGEEEKPAEKPKEEEKPAEKPKEADKPADKPAG